MQNWYVFWIDFELWFWIRRSCVIWEQAGALYNLMNVDKYLVQATPPFKSKNIFLKKYFHKSQVLLGGPIICSSSAVNIYQLTKIKDHFKMLWHFPKTKKSFISYFNKEMCKSGVSLNPMLFNWLELNGMRTSYLSPTPPTT